MKQQTLDILNRAVRSGGAGNLEMQNGSVAIITGDATFFETVVSLAFEAGVKAERDACLKICKEISEGEYAENFATGAGEVAAGGGYRFDDFPLQWCLAER